MAATKVRINRTLEANVAAGTGNDGKLHFTEEQNIYLIGQNGQKIKFTDVIFVEDEAAMNALSKQYVGKIYVALNEKTFHYWDAVGSQFVKFTFGALLSNNNLSDVPNKATARTNLGVYSVTEVDNLLAAKRVLYNSIRAISANHTLQASDHSSFIAATNASTISVVLPANASVAIPNGFTARISRFGVGDVQFVPDSGVTILSKSGPLIIEMQYGVAVIEKVDTNTWVISGDMQL